MEIKSTTKTTDLELESSFSSQDLKKAETRLPHYGIIGDKALVVLRQLAQMDNLVKEAANTYRLVAHEGEDGVIEVTAKVKFGVPKMPKEDGELLKNPVADLNLSMRARKGVRRLGCETIGDVASLTADRLIEVKNFGSKSLEEIKAKLKTVGLKLRG